MNFKTVCRLYYLFCPLPLLVVLWAELAKGGDSGVWAAIIESALELIMLPGGLYIFFAAPKGQEGTPAIAFMIAEAPAIFFLLSVPVLMIWNVVESLLH